MCELIKRNIKNGFVVLVRQALLCLLTLSVCVLYSINIDYVTDNYSMSLCDTGQSVILCATSNVGLDASTVNDFAGSRFSSTVGYCSFMF